MLDLKSAVVDRALGATYPSNRVREWKERFVSRKYFEERFDVSQRRTTFFFTGPHEQPTGMVALKERDGVAYVGDLYVRTPGKGLGHRLLRHALKEASDRGFDTAVADVFEDNDDGLALLRGEGFKEQGEYVEPSLGVRVHRLALRLAKAGSLAARPCSERVARESKTPKPSGSSRAPSQEPMSPGTNRRLP